MSLAVIYFDVRDTEQMLDRYEMLICTLCVGPSRIDMKYDWITELARQ